MVSTLTNIRLTIEYDGSGFAGWQYQPNQRTVQDEIEKALKKIIGQKTTLYAAGRTDAGVHATGQIANFKSVKPLPAKKYRDALNFYIPDDILIHESISVPELFHARYHAIYRKYQYRIGLGKSVYDRRRWDIGYTVRPHILDEAADAMRGEHDFSTFCVVASQKEDNRCLVYDSHWQQNGDIIVYEITANRFLHSMIRSMVGLMIEWGRGALTRKQYFDIVRSGDHSALRSIAPPQGLCLCAVGY